MAAAAAAVFTEATQLMDGAEQLKYLAERIPATFVYADIDVEHAGLFSGVRGRQIAGRFASIATSPFAYGARAQREQWVALVAALSKQGSQRFAPETLTNPSGFAGHRA